MLTMRKLAQARARSIRKAKKLELAENESDVPPQIIKFGMYRGAKIHLAELIFRNPGYFYWCLSEGAYPHYQGFEAWTISEKISHIRPPRKSPDAFRFDCIFDSKGRFIDYEVVRANRPPTKPSNVSHKVLRVKHLDLSLLSMRNPEIDKACQKLLLKIREDFLREGELRYWDYQEFINTERNFDLSCRETHCPKVPRFKARSPSGFDC